MSEELIKALQKTIDKRMVEARAAQEEAIELARLGYDEKNDDEDDDEPCGEDDEPRDEPHPVIVLSMKIGEAIDLMDVLRKLVAGRSVREIHSAFGAPGNWGYETPIGDALSKLYAGAMWEPKPTAAADAVAAEREACAALFDAKAADAEKRASNLRANANEYTEWDALREQVQDAEREARVAKTSAAAIRARGRMTATPDGIDPAATATGR